jgi:hypothetical protein
MMLSDLLTNLYRRLNWADAPDTATTTRLTMFLNQRHRRLLSSPALRQLREGFGTFTSVAAQAEYALPYGIARVRTMREITNDRVLAERSVEWYRASNPDTAANSGTPDSWVPFGVRAVARRPGALGVWAASSSAADTTQLVMMHATLSTSDPRGSLSTGTTLLTGTTRVRLGGTNTFDDVLTLSLSAACAGTVSFFDAAAAGNTLATMPAGRRTSRLYVFALTPTPASAIDYSVDFEHAITDLANVWDEPLLPEDFHDLLIAAALMDEYQARDDTRYSAAVREYEERLRELKAWLYGHRSALQPEPRREVARLGSWYPFQRP